ncbi:MAG: DUF1232 domain-containing protein [Cyanobacteria bacterium P01_H01_bin.58]
MKRSLFQRVYRSLLGHPVARWFVILGSLAYLLSPVDISPDVFPIIGWVDDGLLVTLLATGITEVVLERRRELKTRKEEEKASTTVETQVTPVDDRPAA